MRDKYIQTAESVTEGHPDKLCDTIADTVLDACLEHDPNAHVACEVLATAGKILVAGEITAKALPDIPAIVARTVHETGYHADYEIEVITHDQSPNIAGAVDRRGIFLTSAAQVIRGLCTVTPVQRRMSCSLRPLYWLTA